MSDDENDDYCGTCAQPGTNDNPLVCCDGCSNAWHENRSCMGVGNRPIFTGYSSMKFFSAVCCAHPLWVIQKTVLDNFECDKTAKDDEYYQEEDSDEEDEEDDDDEYYQEDDSDDNEERRVRPRREC